MFANTLLPIVSTAHLVVRRLIDITRQARTSSAARTYPEGEGSSMTRFTKVAICDSRGVSTVPLTSSSLERRTSLLWALTETTTKPSRRWQPPRVTSTTGLQLDHLVPLDAISQCNARITLTRNRFALLQAQMSYMASKHTYTSHQGMRVLSNQPKADKYLVL